MQLHITQLHINSCVSQSCVTGRRTARASMHGRVVRRVDGDWVGATLRSRYADLDREGLL
jgi:hypothetical protein